MNGKEFILNVCYASRYYPGYDRELEKALGDCDGSGIGLGQRDMSWYYKSKPALVKAVGKLMALKLDFAFDVNAVEY